MNIILKTLSLSLVILLTACSDKKAETTTVIEASENASVYYKEIVKSQAGDFSGFSIGSSMAETKKAFDQQYLVEEESDFLMYKVSEKYTVSEYSLIFDGNALAEIALDTKVYDDADNYDPEAAKQLYKDLKEDFLERFGSKYLEESDEYNNILFWTKDAKEIQLIKDNAEVHVYIDAIQE